MILSIEPKIPNPFRLFTRALRFEGRFDRSQFAVAFFGSLVLAFGTAFLLAEFLQEQYGLRAVVTIVSLLLVILLGVLIAAGCIVRRLNDIGHPPWLGLAIFLPFLRSILLVYLLAMPENHPEAGVPSHRARTAGDRGSGNPGRGRVHGVPTSHHGQHHRETGPGAGVGQRAEHPP